MEHALPKTLATAHGLLRQQGGPPSAPLLPHIPLSPSQQHFGVPGPAFGLPSMNLIPGLHAHPSLGSHHQIQQQQLGQLPPHALGQLLHLQIQQQQQQQQQQAVQQLQLQQQQQSMLHHHHHHPCTLHPQLLQMQLQQQQQQLSRLPQQPAPLSARLLPAKSTSPQLPLPRSQLPLQSGQPDRVQALLLKQQPHVAFSAPLTPHATTTVQSKLPSAADPDLAAVLASDLLPVAPIRKRRLPRKPRLTPPSLPITPPSGAKRSAFSVASFATSGQPASSSAPPRSSRGASQRRQTAASIPSPPAIHLDFLSRPTSSRHAKATNTNPGHSSRPITSTREGSLTKLAGNAAAIASSNTPGQNAASMPSHAPLPPCPHTHPCLHALTRTHSSTPSHTPLPHRAPQHPPTHTQTNRTQAEGLPAHLSPSQQQAQHYGTLATTEAPFGPTEPKHLYLPHHVTKVLATEMETLWGPSPTIPINTSLHIEVDGVLQPEVYANVQFGKSGGEASGSWYVTGIPHTACMGKWHLGWRRQAIQDQGVAVKQEEPSAPDAQQKPGPAHAEHPGSVSDTKEPGFKKETAGTGAAGADQEEGKEAVSVMDGRPAGADKEAADTGIACAEREAVAAKSGSVCTTGTCTGAEGDGGQPELWAGREGGSAAEKNGVKPEGVAGDEGGFARRETGQEKQGEGGGGSLVIGEAGRKLEGGGLEGSVSWIKAQTGDVGVGSKVGGDEEKGSGERVSKEEEEARKTNSQVDTRGEERQAQRSCRSVEMLVRVLSSQIPQPSFPPPNAHLHPAPCVPSLPMVATLHSSLPPTCQAHQHPSQTFSLPVSNHPSYRSSPVPFASQHANHQQLDSHYSSPHPASQEPDQDGAEHTQHAQHSRGTRCRLGPGKGTAVEINEEDVGTLSYPLLRLLDSYKSVSFVRTQELKLLFGNNAKKCLPVTKDVLVELDGCMLPEAYSNVVFKETGASNSVYMKGFPAAMALQKLHCGFRMEGNAVVLLLMTPPPGHPAVIAAAEAAAAAGPKPPRRRTVSTRAARRAGGSRTGGSRTRVSGSKRSRRQPAEIEGGRSLPGNKRLRVGSYALMARMEEEEDAEEDSWEQPDDPEEDLEWEAGSNFDDGAALRREHGIGREVTPEDSWVDQHAAEDGCDGALSEDGWPGGRLQWDREAEQEGKEGGDLAQEQQREEQQEGEQEGGGQHASKRQRLHSMPQHAQHGGSAQPATRGEGSAEGNSSGEASEQVRSDQPRSELRSQRLRRGQRAGSVTAAERGTEEAVGDEPGQELSQRLQALADIAELLGEERGDPAALPPPSSCKPAPVRKPSPAGCAARHARARPSPFTPRGTSRLAGALTPSHSQLRKNDGAAGLFAPIDTADWSAAAVGQDSPSQSMLEGGQSAACIQGRGTSRRKRRAEGGACVLLPHSSLDDAVRACMVMKRGGSLQAENTVEEAEEGGRGPLSCLLRALHALGTSCESLLVAEQALQKHSSTQLEIMQGLALKAVWHTLNLNKAPHLRPPVRSNPQGLGNKESAAGAEDGSPSPFAKPSPSVSGSDLGCPSNQGGGKSEGEPGAAAAADGGGSQGGGCQARTHGASVRGEGQEGGQQGGVGAATRHAAQGCTGGGDAYAAAAAATAAALEVSTCEKGMLVDQCQGQQQAPESLQPKQGCLPAQLPTGYQGMAPGQSSGSNLAVCAGLGGLLKVSGLEGGQGSDPKQPGQNQLSEDQQGQPHQGHQHGRDQQGQQQQEGQDHQKQPQVGLSLQGQKQQQPSPHHPPVHCQQSMAVETESRR